MDKPIYIQPPDGMDQHIKDKDKKVILLKKALYGLKQAAALWYQDAVKTLQSLSMKRTTSDACLFLRKNTLVLMHVDDFQIFSPSSTDIDKLINRMKKKYNIQTVNTNLFLGLYISP